MARGESAAVLNAAVALLAQTGTLPASYLPHPLKGVTPRTYDAHLAPDWVLLYRIRGNDLELVRTGTHADLFR